MSEENRELEHKDGGAGGLSVRLGGRGGVQAPLYGRYVESERARLGEEHPLFRTQYRLLPIAPGEGMFNRSQLALLRGGHSRLRGPLPGRVYVAGVDVAGEPWGASGASSTEEAMRRASGEPWGETPFEFPQGRLRQAQGEPSLGGEYGGYGKAPFEFPQGRLRQAQGERSWRARRWGAGTGRAQTGGRDSTVVTIGEVEVGGRLDAPSVRVVEHYRWTGEPHHALTPSLVELLRRTWRCRAGGGGCDGARHGGCERAGEGDGGRGRAVRVHVGEQVAAGVRAAGGR